MKKTEVLVGKTGDGLELEIYGMDSGGSKDPRRDWERAGGHKLMLATLDAIKVTGKWRLILDRQVHATGTTPNVLVRHVDNEGKICLRLKPGGNNTCLSCRLQAPATMPREMIHAVQAKMAKIDTIGKIGEDKFISVKPPSEDGGELAEPIVNGTPQPERGQPAEKKLPPTPEPAAAKDDDMLSRLMESARSLKNIMEATVQVREIRQAIVGQQSLIEDVQRKADEAIARYKEEIARLRESEKQVVRSLNTEALYESLRLVEEAQAEIEKP